VVQSISPHYSGLGGSGRTAFFRRYTFIIFTYRNRARISDRPRRHISQLPRARLSPRGRSRDLRADLPCRGSYRIKSVISDRHLSPQTHATAVRNPPVPVTDAGNRRGGRRSRRRIIVVIKLRSTRRSRKSQQFRTTQNNRRHLQGRSKGKFGEGLYEGVFGPRPVCSSEDRIRGRRTEYGADFSYFEFQQTKPLSFLKMIFCA